MEIYFDNCCYNRPFDDRSNIRNYLERESILLILQLAYEKKINILGSDVLNKEISVIRDIYKREHVQKIYNSVCMDIINLNVDITTRARQIQSISNIKSFDSLHLACAENRGAILLTTDKKFLNACKKLDLHIKVYNPIEFVIEVNDNECNG